MGRTRLATNQSGFSLVSVVVAMAMIGGLTFAVLAIGRMVNSIQVQADTQSEIFNQLYLARLALSDAKTCTLNFGGRNLGSPNRNLPIPRYRNPADLETLGSDGLFPGRVDASAVRAFVENIHLERDSKNPMAAKLTLEFARDGVGSKFVRSFPLAIQLDSSNRILTCTAGEVNFQTPNGTTGVATDPKSFGNCDSLPDSTSRARRSLITSVCGQLTYPTPAANVPLLTGQQIVFSAYSTDPVFARVENIGSIRHAASLSNLFSNLETRADCLSLPSYPQGSRRNADHAPTGVGAPGRELCISGRWVETSPASGDHSGAGGGGNGGENE